MGKSTECCNQDCNQGRTCPQRNAGRVPVHNMSLHASKGGMINAATGVTLAADRVGTVYVSGPMTGHADWNFPAFNAAADALRSHGYKVINPADHGVVPGAEWEDYLRKDVADLAACEAIHLLPGWSQSKGARLELHLAKALGLRVMYAEGAEHADAAAVDHHPLHQHLLHMLGAKDHVDAGRIIAQHHVRELAAAQQGVLEGFVLVPKRVTPDMQQVMDEDGWLWEDLLAAACAITEKEYAEIATNPTQQGLDTQKLHGEIMNLPVDKKCIEPLGINERLAYKNGHRDARHAAAELVLAAQAKQEAAA